MMCEYLGPVRYFTGDERRSLMEDKRPPDDVSIWIGHSQAPHAIQGSNLHLAPPQMTAPAAYLGYTRDWTIRVPALRVQAALRRDELRACPKRTMGAESVSHLAGE